MTSLTLVTGSTADGRRSIRRLDSLPSEVLPVRDAAIVDWPLHQDRPDAWQVRPVNQNHVLTGSFWGMLFGHLFLLPLSNEVPPAKHTGLTTSLAHLGFGRDRLETIRSVTRPGTVSAFLLHDDDQHPAESKVFSSVSHMTMALSLDQHRRLYAAFGEPERVGA